MSSRRFCCIVVALGVATAACSSPSSSSVFSAAGTGSSAPTPVAVVAPARYSVGGTVTGLAGAGLILADNDGDDLAVSANGTFVFRKTIASGAAFSVAVKQGPTAPTQTCRVVGGTGTVAAGNVTSVVVSCSTDTYVVGGTVSGLVGAGLSISNGTDIASIAAKGTFAFATPLTDGAAYAVTVATSPSSPSQTCAIANAAGTIASHDVANVAVTCTTNRLSLGGHLTGLVGSGLELQNEGADDLPLSADGAFTFRTHPNDGTPFAVTVKTNPVGPRQTCAVAGGTGTLAGGNVSSVTVVCDTNVFAIGGTVSGLVGSGLVLTDNGSDDLPIGANGDFAFGTAVVDQSSYAVAVKSQPTTPWQTCAVDPTTSSGTVSGGAVTAPAITCTTNTYKVGGTVSGLASGCERDSPERRHRRHHGERQR